MEQLLALALQDAVDRAQPALQNEAEWAAAGMESHTFATAFEKRMKHLCAQEKRRVWFDRHQKGLRNAVAGMAVLLCVGGVTIASVDAIRTPLLQYFLKNGVQPLYHHQRGWVSGKALVVRKSKCVCECIVGAGNVGEQQNTESP